MVVIRMTIQLHESPIPTHKNMAISPLVGKRPDFWSRFRFSRKKSENAENKLMSWKQKGYERSAGGKNMLSSVTLNCQVTKIVWIFQNCQKLSKQIQKYCQKLAKLSLSHIQWHVICSKIKSSSVSQWQGHLFSCPQTLSAQLKTVLQDLP